MTCRVFSAVVALAALIGLTAPSPAAGSSASATADPGPPAVAYSTAEHVVVTDRRGTVLSRVPRGFGGYSLGGDLLAKAYDVRGSDHTAGYNATTGKRRFRIEDTLLIPTVVRGGRAVAFQGRGDRDKNAASLWIRNQLGRERELAQFSFGAGPEAGIPTGIPGGTILEYGFDRAADTAAIAAGDELAFFEYDIWAIDVDTREYVRLTRGNRSRYPSVSPNGDQVAYFREDSMCGGPLPGYRGGDLMMVNADGTKPRMMHDGDCGRYFTGPHWLDRRYLVAKMNTRRPGVDPDPLYDSELVLIDTYYRVVSQPISKTVRVSGDFSVSPSMDRVAYGDYTDPNGFWVFTWKPDLSGPGIVTREQDPWAHGTTRRFHEGRIPHLRDDPMLVPSY